MDAGSPVERRCVASVEEPEEIPYDLTRNRNKQNNSASSSDNDMLPTPPGSPSEAKWPKQRNDHSPKSPDPKPMTDSAITTKSHNAELPFINNNPMALMEIEANRNNHLRGLPTALPSGSTILDHTNIAENAVIARALASSVPKRSRGEKKPIPDEQKDGKYFERRKRNNLAAKKSRDARKSREDQIAMRANLLEKENAILRAQVSTLRDEANSLRQLLIQKRNSFRGQI